MTDDRTMRLDDVSALAAADPGGMLAKLAAFPGMLKRARRENLPAAWPAEAVAAPRRLLVGGMGGSAIAGDVLAGLYTALGAPVEVSPVRDYRLPPARPGDRLVLCSYSGNTEEVLSLYGQARDARIEPILVSAGGRLGELGDAEGLTRFDLPPGYPPRSAFPALLGRLLAVGEGLGLHDSEDEALDATLAALDEVVDRCAPERPLESNPAKALALRLGDAHPVFCSMAPAYDAIGLRLRCQVEENAERAAFSRSLPELHHNSWVPWAGDDAPGLAVWIGAEDAHSRVLLRRRLSDEILAEKGEKALSIEASGQALFTRLLTTVLLGDYMSVYHALMRGLDPTPVTPLGAMKERLADLQEHS